MPPAPDSGLLTLMDSLLRLARKLARWGVWFSGALMIAAAFIIGVEVVIRKAFALSIGGVDELGGFALAIGSAWAFSFALLDRAHIRIDSLYMTLPTRVCAFLDILGLSVFMLFMGLVTWHGYGVFAQSADLGARTMSALATPLMIPQFIWVLGLALFLAIAGLLLVRAVLAFVAGDVRGVQRLIGSRSARDELRDELSGDDSGALEG